MTTIEAELELKRQELLTCNTQRNECMRTSEKLRTDVNALNAAQGTSGINPVPVDNGSGNLSSLSSSMISFICIGMMFYFMFQMMGKQNNVASVAAPQY